MAAGFVNWAPTFLMRKFELPVSTVGFSLGGINLVCGIMGMLGSGYIVDYLFRRGVRDAHLRYYAVATLICGVAGVAAMIAPTAALSLGCMAVVKTIIPFIAVAAAGLQITTPNEYRGQVSAIFLFVYNVVGYGLGPSIMAGISDFALGGSGDLGIAMAITFAIFAPLSSLVFVLGLKPMRRAVQAAEAWESR
jgi:MFS family permease